MDIIEGLDPLSIIAKEEEDKKQQILLLQKQEELQQQEKRRNDNKNKHKELEEEEKKLESLTKLHLHQNAGNINSNDTLELKQHINNKWMNHFCVINFDLEIGQILDYAFPSTTTFKEDESTNLCFLSFPDSNSHLQGDIIYSFKLKQTLSNGSTTFQYGYVFFRQEKDSSISRGYLQKSVVLLSDESFVGLFKKVIEIVGPLYFDHGNTLLEVAYQNILSWPELKLGQTYELPILGYILTFHVPHTRGTPHIIDPSVKQHTFSTPWTEMKLVSNLKSIDLHNCFKGFTNKLWMLWEMVLLGEPILVISQTPPMCSDSVLALVSLISPLRYCGDYRPYFTIHDTDFHKYTSTQSNNQIPSSIIGVTNPFFLKAFGHWPNILTVGNSNSRLSSFKKIRSSLPNIMSRDLLSKHVLDNKEKLVSEYKPFTTPDKNVLKKISETIDDTVNNELLRTHFLQLTHTFLIPLERYFSSLMPLAKTISIFQRPPRLKSFDKEEFINRISESDEKLVVDSKSKEIEMYKLFLDSVNFKQWLDDKRSEAIKHLNILYRKAILDADIHSLLKSKPSSTATDLYKRIEDQLILEENLFQTSDEIKQKFRSHLLIIKEYMAVNKTAT